MDAPRRSEVAGTDGVELAVFTQGDRGAPPVLLVHGYPDTHRVWDVVAAVLATRHHVIRYDARGAGDSTDPERVAGYRLSVLAGDARAVAAATRPGERVHLVGHDWGSATGWEAVSATDAGAWVASFTSVSGPHPAHVAAWVASILRHPSPRTLLDLTRQQMASWYLFAFQLPVLPELAWRHVLGGRWAARLRRTEGVVPEPGHPALSLVEDGVHGLALYRANVRAGLRAGPVRRVRVPVQLVVARQDRYVTPPLARSALRWTDQCWLRGLDAGHWGALRTSGGTLARWVIDFAAHVAGASPDAGLLAARAAAARFSSA